MRLNRLPISLCHAICPKCGLPTNFKMFESGAGGDFETYVGDRSGAIYRLDLGKVHYQSRSRSDLLADVMKIEGRLFYIPNEIHCKLCKTAFGATTISVDGEEMIEAYEV